MWHQKSALNYFNLRPYITLTSCKPNLDLFRNLTKYFCCQYVTKYFLCLNLNKWSSFHTLTTWLWLLPWQWRSCDYEDKGISCTSKTHTNADDVKWKKFKMHYMTSKMILKETCYWYAIPRDQVWANLCHPCGYLDIWTYIWIANSQNTVDVRLAVEVVFIKVVVHIDVPRYTVSLSALWPRLHSNVSFSNGCFPKH